MPAVALAAVVSGFLIAGCASGPDPGAAPAEVNPPSEIEKFFHRHDPYVIHSRGTESEPASDGWYAELGALATEILMEAGDGPDTWDLLSTLCRVLFAGKKLTYDHEMAKKECRFFDAGVLIKTTPDLFRTCSVAWLLKKKSSTCLPLALASLFLLERLGVDASLVIFGMHAMVSVRHENGNSVYLDPSSGQIIPTALFPLHTWQIDYFISDYTRYPEASALDQSALRSHALQIRAFYSLLNGKREDAFGLFNEAASAENPRVQLIESHCQALGYYSRWRDLAERIESYGRGRRLSGILLYWLACAKSGLGAKEEALEAIAKADATRPRSPPILEIYYHLLSGAGHKEEAEKVLGRLESITSRTHAVIVRLTAEEACGRKPDKALAGEIDARDFASLPDHLLLAAARYCSGLKETGKSETAADEIASRDPFAPVVAESLADAYLAAGRKIKARKWLQKALEGEEKLETRLKVLSTFDPHESGRDEFLRESLKRYPGEERFSKPD